MQDDQNKSASPSASITQTDTQTPNEEPVSSNPSVSIEQPEEKLADEPKISEKIKPSSEDKWPDSTISANLTDQTSTPSAQIQVPEEEKLQPGITEEIPVEDPVSTEAKKEAEAAQKLLKEIE